MVGSEGGTDTATAVVASAVDIELVLLPVVTSPFESEHAAMASANINSPAGPRPATNRRFPIDPPSAVDWWPRSIRSRST
jgi:hypothetical protein